MRVEGPRSASQGTASSSQYALPIVSDRFDVHQVSGAEILEHWIPAEELDELNAQLVGLIEVVDELR